MLLNLLLQSQTPQSSSGSSAFFLVQILLLFAIMYFLLILPMQRQRKRQQRMLRELQNGLEVVTTGGIIGQIVAINTDSDTLVLRVKPDNIKIQVARSAVATVVQSAEAAAVKK